MITANHLLFLKTEKLNAYMKNLYLPLLLTLVLFTGCLDESSTPEQNFAIGMIQAEFSDLSGTEAQPITNTEMDLFVNIEGETENIYVTRVLTDENGVIETDISAGQEFTVINIIFEFELDGEIRTVEEEVTLQLNYEEPYEDVSLVFEVGAESDGNGGDESQ